MAAAVGLPGVLSAATAKSARDDTTDRAQLHRLPRLRAVPCLTLVTLDCTPFDIATSVSEKGGAVYSPTVLRLRDHPRTPGTPDGPVGLVRPGRRAYLV